MIIWEDSYTGFISMRNKQVEVFFVVLLILDVSSSSILDRDLSATKFIDI